MKKNIFILGMGYSGSSAIFDYLKQNYNFTDPFEGFEFRLAHDPGGLNDFYNSCASGSIYDFSEGYRNLDRYMSNLNRMRKKYYYGFKINQKVFKEYNNFKNKILKSQYRALPMYVRHDFNITMSFSDIILNKLNIKSPVNYLFSKKYFIPKEIDKKKILKIIKDYTDKILISNNNLINQGLSFVNPMQSAKFFSNPLIVRVYRDPRDMYLSLMKKGRGLPTQLESFIDYYKYVSLASKKNYSDKIFDTNFENFIKYKSERLKLLNFLGLKPKDEAFNFEFSLSRMEKYKKDQKNQLSIQNIYSNILKK